MVRESNLPSATFLFVVVSCITLTGCGSKISKSNYDKIKDRMTEAEVEALLGNGEEQASSNLSLPGASVGIPGVGGVSIKGISSSTKVMKWQDGNQAITVIFSDGKVTAREQTGL